MQKNLNGWKSIQEYKKNLKAGRTVQKFAKSNIGMKECATVGQRIKTKKLEYE